jgi:hypothetical protein
MARSITRRALPVLALLFVAGCGGSDNENSSPAGPSATPPPPSGVAVVSGEWNATAGFQQNGVTYISNMTASVTQTDRNVDGTFRFTSPGFSDWRGRFTGTLAGTSPDTQFVGTLTMQADPSTGTGLCRSSVVVAGRSISNSMRWEAESFTMVNDVPTQPASSCRGQFFTPVWIFFR